MIEQARLKIHELICRCTVCKGTIEKKKLCAPCGFLDAMLDDPDGPQNPQSAILNPQSKELHEPR